MRNIFVCLVLACVVCSPLFAQSASAQYQSGTIVSVDNHPVQGGGGTDAPLKPNVADHDVSIQVGDTVYVCRFHSVSDQDLSWLRNKDVQVRIQGKVMHVKQSVGKDAKVKILSTTKATQP